MTTSANPPIMSSVSGDDAEADTTVAAVRRAVRLAAADRVFVLAGFGFSVVRRLTCRRPEGCGAGGCVTTGVRTIAGDGDTGTDGCGCGGGGGDG